MQASTIVALLAAMGAVLAAPAKGGPAAVVVDRDPPVVSITGTAADEVSGARPRGTKIQVKERGGPPLRVSGEGCELVGSRVMCRSADIERLRVALGPGADDHLSKLGRLAANIHEVIRGGAGRDDLSLRDGSPARQPYEGADVWGESGNDHVEGGPGDDRVLGGAGNDHVKSADADDRSGDDFLSGGEGDDRLIGARGDDVLRGGPGQDLCVPRGGKDRIYGCERVEGH
jgi:RTX calcium-binding nonapeptide repeat (4 copies)